MHIITLRKFLIERNNKQCVLINGWKQGISFESDECTLQLTSWLNDKRDGKEITLYDGELWTKYNFKNGRRHGILIEYIFNSKPKLHMVELFKEGQLKIRIGYNAWNGKIRSIKFNY